MKLKTFINMTGLITMASLFIVITLLVVFAPKLVELKNSNIVSMKVAENKHEDLTQSVAQVCSLFDNDRKKVDCVHGIVVQTDLYNFMLNESFVLADDLKEQGGDCKSWTIFYLAVFDLMDIEAKEIFIKNHVFVVVYSDDFYCVVDQESKDCRDYNFDLLGLYNLTLD